MVHTAWRRGMGSALHDSVGSRCVGRAAVLLQSACSGNASSNAAKTNRVDSRLSRTLCYFIASICRDVWTLPARSHLHLSGVLADTNHPGRLRRLLSLHSNSGLAAHHGDYRTLFGKRKAPSSLVYHLLLPHTGRRILVAEERADRQRDKSPIFITNELEKLH